MQEQQESNKRPESCTLEQTFVCFSQLVLQPITSNPGFNYASPLHTSHHEAMSVWLFPLALLLNAQLQPNVLKLVQYSSFLVHETCSAGRPTGSGPEQPPSPPPLCAQRLCKTQPLQLPENNEATLRPAVFMLARGLVFSIYAASLLIW